MNCNKGKCVSKKKIQKPYHRLNGIMFLIFRLCFTCQRSLIKIKTLMTEIKSLILLL